MIQSNKLTLPDAAWFPNDKREAQTTALQVFRVKQMISPIQFAFPRKARLQRETGRKSGSTSRFNQTKFKSITFTRRFNAFSDCVKIDCTCKSDPGALGESKEDLRDRAHEKNG
jgi:hypothetical protein